MAVRCSANFSEQNLAMWTNVGDMMENFKLTDQRHQDETHKHVTDLSFVHDILNLLD